MQNIKRDNLIFGRYRLHQSLGKGSFGEVFYAEDIQFDPPRVVAFKLLHPQYTSDANVREDLKREAGVLARFDHPNILRVLDFGINEEMAFIVMELAQGGSLARRLRPDPTKPPVAIPLPEVAIYLDQIADALDEAHDQGLIHRDIKPQNILMDRRGRMLVADFGLATAVNGSSSSVMVDTSGSGTPLYMSPEQWQGRAGRASDIYSLGAVLYQMISGQPPFHGNQYELFGQHLNSPTPRLSDQASGLVYPPALDGVIAHAMAKDPRQRIRPAKELARQFRLALTTAPNALPPNSQPTMASTPIVVRPALPNPAGSGTASIWPVRPVGPNTQPGPAMQPPNYQPNFNQAPRSYDNAASSVPGQAASYQNLNQAASNSAPPYQGLVNQSNSAPPYQVAASQPRPGPVVPLIPPTNQPGEVTRTKKGANPLVWLALLLLIILIAVGAVFALMNLNKPGNSSATPVAQVTTTSAGTTLAAATTAAVGTTAPVSTLSETVASVTTAGTVRVSTTAAPVTTALPTTAPATTPPATTTGPTATPAAFGTNVVTFKAHDSIVLNLAFSPDGKTVASASEDGAIKLWDIQDQRKKAVFNGSSGPVRAIAYSPDGKLLVAGSADKIARIWDTTSGQPNVDTVKPKFTLQGHTGVVTSVAFSPDGKSVATGSDDHTIRLWDVQTGQSFGTLTGHKDNVTSVAYTPDGKTLASGSRDSSIKLWDIATGKERTPLDGVGHSGSIWSLAFSHDGKSLASGSLDKSTRLWDTNPFKLRFLLDDSTMGIRQVAFSPDDTFVATACDDKSIYLWGVKTGLEEAKFEGHAAEVYSVAISPDGKILVSGSADGVIKFWSLAGKK